MHDTRVGCAVPVFRVREMNFKRFPQQTTNNINRLLYISPVYVFKYLCSIQ